MPRNLRFLAKRELFWIPVFGWYRRLGGHVPVDRGDKARVKASLFDAAARVKSGTSLVAFPEGSRSKDGSIKPFKKGPFALAMESGVPVVPVAVSGSGAIAPRGVIAVRQGVIRLAVGAPLYPERFPDRTALLAAPRARIVALHLALGGKGDGPALGGRAGGTAGTEM